MESRRLIVERTSVMFQQVVIRARASGPGKVGPGDSSAGGGIGDFS